MILKDTMKLKGRFKIYTKHTWEPETAWKKRVDQKNLIVTVGKTLVRDLISNQTTNYVKGFGFGIGTTVPAAGDVALETPVDFVLASGNELKAFLETSEPAVNSFRIVGYVASNECNTVGGSADLTEVGLGTTDAAGWGAATMYCRATFDAITKTISLQMRLEYILEF